MVAAQDLGSCDFGRVGSSPISRTSANFCTLAWARKRSYMKSIVALPAIEGHGKRLLRFVMPKKAVENIAFGNLCTSSCTPCELLRCITLNKGITSLNNDLDSKLCTENQPLSPIRIYQHCILMHNFIHLYTIIMHNCAYSVAYK